MWPHTHHSSLLSTGTCCEITHPLVCPVVPESHKLVEDLSCPQTAEHRAEAAPVVLWKEAFESLSPLHAMHSAHVWGHDSRVLRASWHLCPCREGELTYSGRGPNSSRSGGQRTECLRVRLLKAKGDSFLTELVVRHGSWAVQCACVPLALLEEECHQPGPV